MSEREPPIVLPSLGAQRSEPSAAVCASGHLLSWFVEAGVEVGHCAKCGEPILRACPDCNAPLPADGEMLRWVPYHAYCSACGKAYPWTAAEIARARRTLGEFAQAEGWQPIVKQRAEEIVDDIVGERATASYVTAGLRWLAQQGAESATPAILDVVNRIASADLKTALRPNFPGLF